MEKKTAEEVLDNNCKAVYGFNKSKENSRIYERKDIITAMEEFSSLQSEEKDKEIERLREALKRVKNWAHMSNHKGYTIDMLFNEVEQALSNQPIDNNEQKR